MLKSAEDNGYSAILIHGTGLGHLPIENSNGDAPENDELAKTIIDMSIPVIVANQCVHGPVDLNVYSKGRIQQDMGVMGHGSNASPEALLVKIHWILSNGLDLTYFHKTFVERFTNPEFLTVLINNRVGVEQLMSGNTSDELEDLRYRRDQG